MIVQARAASQMPEMSPGQPACLLAPLALQLHNFLLQLLDLRLRLHCRQTRIRGAGGE
jgi:hypothetical protein